MKKSIIGLLVLPFMLSLNISGQESSNNEIEEIVVTGSNIQRSGYSAISPVQVKNRDEMLAEGAKTCLLYTSPSPRDRQKYRMPSSA